MFLAFLSLCPCMQNADYIYIYCYGAKIFFVGRLQSCFYFCYMYCSSTPKLHVLHLVFVLHKSNSHALINIAHMLIANFLLLQYHQLQYTKLLDHSHGSFSPILHHCFIVASSLFHPSRHLHVSIHGICSPFKWSLSVNAIDQDTS